MIKCGNCRQRHASVDEVRECYAIEDMEANLHYCPSCDAQIARSGLCGGQVCRRDFPDSFR